MCINTRIYIFNFYIITNNIYIFTKPSSQSYIKIFYIHIITSFKFSI